PGAGRARPYMGQGLPLPDCPAHQQARTLMFDEPDTVMVRWAELEAMRRAGTFEVHSHTHTHRRWDLECNSRSQKHDQIHADLLQSRQTLQSQLGSVSSHLCWPQGYFDDDYLDAARDLGFTHLYTT